MLLVIQWRPESLYNTVKVSLWKPWRFSIEDELSNCSDEAFVYRRDKGLQLSAFKIWLSLEILGLKRQYDSVRVSDTEANVQERERDILTKKFALQESIFSGSHFEGNFLQRHRPVCKCLPRKDVRDSARIRSRSRAESELTELLPGMPECLFFESLNLFNPSKLTYSH